MGFFILRFILFSGGLYLFYRLLFSRKSFFQLNRIVILVIPVVSIMIPLIAPFFTSPLSSEPVVGSLLPEVSISATIYEAPAGMLLSFNYWWLLYATGALSILAMLIMGLMRAWSILRSSSHAFDNVYFSEKARGPFAFFQCIVIPAQLASSEQLASVLAHEKAHVDQKHTLDNLFYNLLSALFWFNPFIHLLHAELRQNHEYLADEQALAESNPENYSRLLLGSVFGSELSFDPANRFFNSSLIKTRITMIYKAKTKPVMKGLYLLLIPLIAIMSVTSCQKTQDDVVTKGIKTAEIGLMEADQPPLFDHCDETASKNEMIACFHKGVMTYVVENFKYPEKAKELRLEARIYVQFIITKDGAVEITGTQIRPMNDPEIKKSKNKVSDEEVSHALEDAEEYASELISSLSGLNPAIKDGQPVAVRFALPIMMKLE